MNGRLYASSAARRFYGLQFGALAHFSWPVSSAGRRPRQHCKFSVAVMVSASNDCNAVAVRGLRFVLHHFQIVDGGTVPVRAV